MQRRRIEAIKVQMRAIGPGQLPVRGFYHRGGGLYSFVSNNSGIADEAAEREA
jgi:hypothetical protein